MRHDGFLELPWVPWVGEFVDYLAKCPKYPGHVRAIPRDGIFCNEMADVMAAPYFLEYAQSYLPLASDYFGEPAHLWSLNAFYTDENTPFIPSVMGKHRDTEAPKILVLFLLGYDTELDGAQMIQRAGSQISGGSA